MYAFTGIRYLTALTRTAELLFALFSFTLGLPPVSTLFPYTTLFRSALCGVEQEHGVLRLRTNPVELVDGRVHLAEEPLGDLPELFGLRAHRLRGVLIEPMRLIHDQHVPLPLVDRKSVVEGMRASTGGRE